MNKLQAGLFALALALLGAGITPASAQVGCTVLPQTSLLQAFSDAAPVNSITPAAVRNIICSVPSLAIGSSVSSVGLNLPNSMFAVSGSPVTGSGTLNATFTNQNPGLVFAGPTSGGATTPTFRALVASDLPSGVGLGTVTSAGLALPNIFSVSGSPITGTGTLTGSLVSQTANTFFAGPNGSSGTPTFRTILLADLPGGVGLGSVTSVALSLPAMFNVTGGAVTTTGTLTAGYASTSQSFVLAGPTSGSGTPTQRQLACADLSNSTATCTTAIGTSGSALGRLNTANTYSAGQVTAPASLTSGSTVNIDLTTANVFTLTLGANATLANPTGSTPVGECFTLFVTQDGTGSRTLAYGSQYKWPGGSAPTLTTTAAAVDVISGCTMSSSFIAVTWLGNFK